MKRMKKSNIFQVKTKEESFFFPFLLARGKYRAAYPIQFVQTTLPSDHTYSIVIGTVSRELHHPDDSKKFNLNYVIQVQFKMRQI